MIKRIIEVISYPLLTIDFQNIIKMSNIKWFYTIGSSSNIVFNTLTTLLLFDLYKTYDSRILVCQIGFAVLSYNDVL